MLIACKYEDVSCPNVEDMVYITDNSYSKEELMEMELSVLGALDYSLGAPSAVHFLRRYSRIAEVESRCVVVMLCKRVMCPLEWKSTTQSNSLRVTGGHVTTCTKTIS